MMSVNGKLQAATLAGFLVLSACSGTEPSEPLLPAGAVAISAPAQYQEWWAKTEACSSLTGSYESIRWYVVPNVQTFKSEFGATVALWRKLGNENIIILSGDYQQDEMVVRHEMLHALLEREGHPTQYFVTDCSLTWDSWRNSQYAQVGGQGSVAF